MGLDVAITPLLAHAARLPRPAGEALMLGRQEVFIPPQRLARLEAGLAAVDPALCPVDPTLLAGYAEPLLGHLGLPGMRSLDAAAYEASDLVHDMNDPVPDALRGRFALIFDGGTLEHVFNMAQALHNVHDMLMPGGLFIAATPGDGWFGHGFWQTSPEVVFSYWATARGYDVIEAVEVPRQPGRAPAPIPDPRQSGKRAQSQHAGQVCYLYYVVRRPLVDPVYRTPQQSDYVTLWEKSDAAPVAGGTA